MFYVLVVVPPPFKLKPKRRKARFQLLVAFKQICSDVNSDLLEGHCSLVEIFILLSMDFVKNIVANDGSQQLYNRHWLQNHKVFELLVL